MIGCGILCLDGQFFDVFVFCVVLGFVIDLVFSYVLVLFFVFVFVFVFVFCVNLKNFPNLKTYLE